VRTPARWRSSQGCAGTIHLDGVDLRALHEGRMEIALFTAGHTTGTSRTALVLPAAAR
jgi:hypothetical protein